MTIKPDVTFQFKQRQRCLLYPRILSILLFILKKAQILLFSSIFLSYLTNLSSVIPLIAYKRRIYIARNEFPRKDVLEASVYESIFSSMYFSIVLRRGIDIQFIHRANNDRFPYNRYIRIFPLAII